jgi:hypothetical protein
MTIESCAKGGQRLSEAYVLCFKLVQKELASEMDVYVFRMHKAAAS